MKGFKRLTYIFVLYCMLVVPAAKASNIGTAYLNNLLKDAAANRYKNSKKSIRLAFQVLEKSKQEQYKIGIAKASYELAKAYFLLDDYKNSFEYITACIEIAEKIDDKILISDAYMALSNIYVMQNNKKQARLYQQKALKIKTALNDYQAVTDIVNNIGYSYYRNKMYDSAMVYYRKSLASAYGIQYARAISNTLQNIGHIYNDTQQYDSALKYYNLSLPQSIQLHDLQLTSKNYVKIAQILVKRNQFNEAIKNLNLGMQYVNEIGMSEIMCDYYKTYSLLYEQQHNFGKAYMYSKKYYSSLDSFNQTDVAKKVNEMQFSFEMKRKNHEQELKNAAHKASIAKRNFILYIVAAVMLLVLVLLVNIYRNYRSKQKANKLLVEKNEIIEEQKKHVEEKNRDITDSINYARKIQLALLKEQTHVSKHLPEHFIYYQPKDIVAGDFYWSLERDNYLYLAAADCTGHGVPGAFLTMLGVAFLNEITALQSLSTSEILNRLRVRFIKELSQTGAAGENKDGMDISLIRLDLKTRELQWSGANNPLWIVSKHIHATQQQTDNPSIPPLNCVEIKPDKQPIGYHAKTAPFTQHTLALNSGDTFYLFTDGYADQFGGVSGKKYKYQRLKEKIMAVQQQALVKQKEMLSEEFTAWKGNFEQLDDVCIIGVRV